MLFTLALFLAPALVSAHGSVTSYKIGGQEYPGYEVSLDIRQRRGRRYFLCFLVDRFIEIVGLLEKRSVNQKNRVSLPSPGRRSSSASGQTTTRS